MNGTAGWDHLAVGLLFSYIFISFLLRKFLLLFFWKISPGVFTGILPFRWKFYRQKQFRKFRREAAWVLLPKLSNFCCNMSPQFVRKLFGDFFFHKFSCRKSIRNSWEKVAGKSLANAWDFFFKNYSVCSYGNPIRIQGLLSKCMHW